MRYIVSYSYFRYDRGPSYLARALPSLESNMNVLFLFKIEYLDTFFNVFCLCSFMARMWLTANDWFVCILQLQLGLSRLMTQTKR